MTDICQGLNNYTDAIFKNNSPHPTQPPRQLPQPFAYLAA